MLRDSEQRGSIGHDSRVIEPIARPILGFQTQERISNSVRKISSIRGQTQGIEQEETELTEKIILLRVLRCLCWLLFKSGGLYPQDRRHPRSIPGHFLRGFRG